MASYFIKFNIGSPNGIKNFMFNCLYIEIIVMSPRRNSFQQLYDLCMTTPLKFRTDGMDADHIGSQSSPAGVAGGG